jgi:hypothetical protein
MTLTAPSVCARPPNRRMYRTCRSENGLSVPIRIEADLPAVPALHDMIRSNPLRRPTLVMGKGEAPDDPMRRMVRCRGV